MAGDISARTALSAAEQIHSTWTDLKGDEPFPIIDEAVVALALEEIVRRSVAAGVEYVGDIKARRLLALAVKMAEDQAAKTKAAADDDGGEASDEECAPAVAVTPLEDGHPPCTVSDDDAFDFDVEPVRPSVSSDEVSVIPPATQVAVLSEPSFPPEEGFDLEADVPPTPPPTPLTEDDGTTIDAVADEDGEGAWNTLLTDSLGGGASGISFDPRSSDCLIRVGDGDVARAPVPTTLPLYGAILDHVKKVSGADTATAGSMTVAVDGKDVTFVVVVQQTDKGEKLAVTRSTPIAEASVVEVEKSDLPGTIPLAGDLSPGGIIRKARLARAMPPADIAAAQEAVDDAVTRIEAEPEVRADLPAPSSLSGNGRRMAVVGIALVLGAVAAAATFGSRHGDVPVPAVSMAPPPAPSAAAAVPEPAAPASAVAAPVQPAEVVPAPAPPPVQTDGLREKAARVQKDILSGKPFRDSRAETVPRRLIVWEGKGYQPLADADIWGGKDIEAAQRATVAEYAAKVDEWHLAAAAAASSAEAKAATDFHACLDRAKSDPRHAAACNLVVPKVAVVEPPKIGDLSGDSQVAEVRRALQDHAKGPKPAGWVEKAAEIASEPSKIRQLELANAYVVPRIRYQDERPGGAWLAPAVAMGETGGVCRDYGFAEMALLLDSGKWSEDDLRLVTLIPGSATTPGHVVLAARVDGKSYVLDMLARTFDPHGKAWPIAESVEALRGFYRSENSKTALMGDTAAVPPASRVASAGDDVRLDTTGKDFWEVSKTAPNGLELRTMVGGRTEAANWLTKHAMDVAVLDKPAVRRVEVVKYDTPKSEPTAAAVVTPPPVSIAVAHHDRPIQGAESGSPAAVGTGISKPIDDAAYLDESR